MRRFSIGLTLIMAIFATDLAAQSAEQIRAAFREEVEQSERNGAGCTYMRRRMRDLQKRFPEAHFVFAGRKDRTITGIRGCGYAWNINSREHATQRAMENCRKWEVEYGTDGGTKTCRILK